MGGGDGGRGGGSGISSSVGKMFLKVVFFIFGKKILATSFVLFVG